MVASQRSVKEKYPVFYVIFIYCILINGKFLDSLAYLLFSVFMMKQLQLHVYGYNDFRSRILVLYFCGPIDSTGVVMFY